MTQSSKAGSQESVTSMKAEYTNLSFTDNRNVAHNGFFYTKYDTEEACRKDADQLIKQLHKQLGKEVVGGYTVVYNDTLKSYVAKYVGLDGLPIKDSKILIPGLSE